jgi:hypothetical protein
VAAARCTAEACAAAATAGVAELRWVPGGVDANAAAEATAAARPHR